MLERGENVVNAGQDKVIGRRQRHGDVLGGKPRKSVANTRATGVPEPHGVTPIGLEGGARVPSISAVGRPRGSFGGFDMNEDSNPGWGNRSTIEVDDAVELGMRGQPWIDPRTAKEVEREFSLG